MALNNLIKFRRGLKASLTSMAGSSAIVAGEPYLITDEGRLAVGLTPTTFSAFLKQGEGVTAVGVTTANGISGSSSGGTTPNLTLTLGAITPTSVASSGGITGTTLGLTGAVSATGGFRVGPQTGTNVSGFNYLDSSGAASSQLLYFSSWNPTETLRGYIEGNSQGLTLRGVSNLIFNVDGSESGYTTSTAWNFEKTVNLTTGIKLNLAACTASIASVKLPHGTAPSSPIDGDMWTTSAGLFTRINGSTVGPLIATYTNTLGPDGDKGDITVGGTGTTLTIDANAVTVAKMQQIATASFLGRTTAATGNVEVLNATQATALLDLATGSVKGLMSSSDFTKLAGVASGATANTGTVTAIGVTTANGVSGSSSGGATPNLTLTLGAITPSSVNASTGSITGGVGTFTLGTKLGLFTAEKEFDLFFPANVANQKIRLYWPTGTRLQGRVEITAACGFENASASGFVKRTYALYLSEGSGKNTHEVMSEAAGLTNNHLTISDFLWDSGTSQWYVAIAQLSATSNYVGVTVKTYSDANTGAAAWSNMAATNVTASAVSTADTTVFASIPKGIGTFPSAAGGAGLNLPHGAAPTTPIDGDLWSTTAGLYARINGGTVGPFGAGGGGGVTSISVTSANGISGSSSGGATPALTLALDAITPTTIVASGLITSRAGIRLDTGTSGTTSPAVDFYASSGSWKGNLQSISNEIWWSTNTGIGAIVDANGIGFQVRNAGTTKMTVAANTTQFGSSHTVVTAASGTTRAGLNIPHGTAPTTPSNGDFWSTTAGFYGQVNGVTVGPFGTGGGGGAAWGSITGTLSAQTDLQSALDLKLNVAAPAMTGNVTVTKTGAGTFNFIDNVTQVGGFTWVSGTFGITSASFMDVNAGNDINFYRAVALRLTIGASGVTTAGKLTTAASATGGAGFRLPAGAAPTTPAAGDMWTTTSGVFAYINGATVGPFTNNSSDATLLARANHTGTQAVSTILAANTSRFFGRITAAGGAGEELTGTQATTLLDAFTTSLKGVVPAGNSNKQYLRSDATWQDDLRTITYVVDGGGSAITTGLKGYLEIPFACTIVGWTLLADVSTSTVVDVWKDTYANYPPVVGDVITASAKPTITTALKGQSSTLTGWTTAVAAGDIMAFNVNSNNNAKMLTLSLKVKVD